MMKRFVRESGKTRPLATRYFFNPNPAIKRTQGASRRTQSRHSRKRARCSLKRQDDDFAIVLSPLRCNLVNILRIIYLSGVLASFAAVASYLLSKSPLCQNLIAPEKGHL